MDGHVKRIAGMQGRWFTDRTHPGHFFHMDIIKEGAVDRKASSDGGYRFLAVSTDVDLTVWAVPSVKEAYMLTFSDVDLFPASVDDVRAAMEHHRKMYMASLAEVEHKLEAEK